MKVRFLSKSLEFYWEKIHIRHRKTNPNILFSTENSCANYIFTAAVPKVCVVMVWALQGSLQSITGPSPQSKPLNWGRRFIVMRRAAVCENYMLGKLTYSPSLSYHYFEDHVLFLNPEVSDGEVTAWGVTQHCHLLLGTKDVITVVDLSLLKNKSLF